MYSILCILLRILKISFLLCFWAVRLLHHHGQSKVHLYWKGDRTTGSCKQSAINLALCSIINCSLLFPNLITFLPPSPSATTPL
jgi:hypothetical protein